MARDYSQRLKNCGIAVVDKERLKSCQVKIKKISGEIKDKSVLLADDIIDTGNTLIAAAEAVKKLGAKKIYACVTHGIFSKNAVSKINKSPISKLFITDTLPFSFRKKSKKIKIISAAPLLAKAIQKIRKI